MGPCQDGPAAELFPVVGPDRFGSASRGAQLFQDAYELITTQCTLWHDCYGFGIQTVHALVVDQFTSFESTRVY
jgi:hypothetical protein